MSNDDRAAEMRALGQTMARITQAIAQTFTLEQISKIEQQNAYEETIRDQVVPTTDARHMHYVRASRVAHAFTVYARVVLETIEEESNENAS